mgnify:CR=1 FL=1
MDKYFEYLLEYRKKETLPELKAGSFYFFKYKSKYYELKKLKYYDRQPLILCLKKEGKYMWGINFHYLPKRIRYKLLKVLSILNGEQFLTNRNLPKIKWDMFKIQVEFVKPQFLVKKYLLNRVDKPVKIKNTEMKQSIKTREEDFIGVSAETVWKLWKQGKDI